MKKLSAVILAGILLLAMNACSDPDATTQLTDGKWTFLSMTTDSENETIQQTILVTEALMKDATLVMNEDKTFIMESPILETETGTWELIGEDQLMISYDNGIETTANIETLSKDRLKYLEIYVDEQQVRYSLTTTWKR
jgi:hypothetical protein